MKENQTPEKNIKIVIRSAHPKVKILLIVLIVSCMAALIALACVRGNILAETQKLKDEAADLQQANSVLDERTQNPGSLDTVKDIAKEELGLVDPDSIVINPHD